MVRSAGLVLMMPSLAHLLNIIGTKLRFSEGGGVHRGQEMGPTIIRIRESVSPLNVKEVCLDKRRHAGPTFTILFRAESIE